MKIICIGRNYIDHAKELNNPIPSEPVFFLKPDTALIPVRNPFVIPSFSNDVHYEVELVVKICRLGKHIDKQFAHKYYNEISVGVDFTARDVQQECKTKGLPWEKAKAFDGSAPTGTFISKDEFIDLNNINFSIQINGETKQLGNTKDMLFDIDTIIEYVSKFCTLKIGDYIFTGTPAGVGKINNGDKVECFIENEKLLSFNVR